MKFTTIFASHFQRCSVELLSSCAWFRRSDHSMAQLLPTGMYVPSGNTSSETHTMRVSSISTSKSMNRFRDHNCSHQKFDGDFTALGSEPNVASCIRSDFLPEPYHRGKYSYLEYDLPPLLSDGFVLSPGKEYYFKYSQPRDWDKPDGSMDAEFSTARHPCLYLFYADVYKGFCFTVEYFGRRYYSSNNYYTEYTCVASIPYSYYSNYQKKWESSHKAVIIEQHVVNNGYCPLGPDPTGFEAQWNALDALNPIEPLDLHQKINDMIDLFAANYRADNAASRQKEVVLPAVDYDSLCKLYDRRLSKVVFPDRLNDWQLCVKAIQNCRVLGLNTLEFCKDLPEFGKDLLQSVRKLTRLTSKKKLAKWVASSYLSYNYGSRMTVSDVATIHDDFDPDRVIGVYNRTFSTVHANESVYGSDPKGLIHAVCVRNCKIYYNPIDSRLKHFELLLENLGLSVNPENTWDMVPFSFVVDWFVNTGELVETQGAYKYASLLDVLSFVSSEKVVYTTSAQVFPGWSGNLLISRYNRNVSSKLPQPCFDLKLQTNFLSHIAELSAIAVTHH